MDDGQLEARDELYVLALRGLAQNDARWAANYRHYNQLTPSKRDKYINWLEAQAAKDLPMAVEIVSRAALIRMTK